MTVVVGVGNPWRNDDGIGHHVARLVAARLRAARLVTTDGEPSRLIDTWGPDDEVVIIDAVRTGAPPGTVHRWDAALRAHTGAGSHSVGPGDAVALAATLHRLPRALAIVGIEVADTGHGDRFSPAVAAAIPAAVQAALDAAQAGSKATSSSLDA